MFCLGVVMVNLERRLGESEASERYRKRIMHEYSADFYDKSIRFFSKKRFLLFGKNFPDLFFKKIVVRGEENVRRVGDKQLLYVSNHTSMADFLVQGYVFSVKRLPIPRIVAGENLNKGPLAGCLKNGARFMLIGLFLGEISFIGGFMMIV